MTTTGVHTYGLMEDDDVAQPIRLPMHVAAEYAAQNYLTTPHQEQWAKERMLAAHTNFIEHISNRYGYGRVVLMQDVPNDQGGAQVTKTSAAQSSQRSKQLYDELKRRLPSMVDLTEELYDAYKEAQTRATKMKKEKDRLGRANMKDSEEYKDANEEYNDRNMYATGFRTAMYVLIGDDSHSPFLYDEGGWFAMLAWWKQRFEASQAATAEGMDEENEQPAAVESDYGTVLCMRYAGSASQAKKSSEQDSARRKWNALWYFLALAFESLDAEQRGKVERIKTAKTFTWEELGVELT